MYIFVRITAVIFMILGFLLIIGGIIAAVLGAVNMFTGPQEAIPGMTFIPMMIGESGPIIVGLFTIFQGLVTTAFGQLMLLFIDIARASQETALQLRAMRRTE